MILGHHLLLHRAIKDSSAHCRCFTISFRLLCCYLIRRCKLHNFSCCRILKELSAYLTASAHWAAFHYRTCQHFTSYRSVAEAVRRLASPLVRPRQRSKRSVVALLRECRLTPRLPSRALSPLHPSCLTTMTSTMTRSSNDHGSAATTSAPTWLADHAQKHAKSDPVAAERRRTQGSTSSSQGINHSLSHRHRHRPSHPHPLSQGVVSAGRRAPTRQHPTRSTKQPIVLAHLRAKIRPPAQQPTPRTHRLSLELLLVSTATEPLLIHFTKLSLGQLDSIAPLPVTRLFKVGTLSTTMHHRSPRTTLLRQDPALHASRLSRARADPWVPQLYLVASVEELRIACARTSRSHSLNHRHGQTQRRRLAGTWHPFQPLPPLS